MKTKALAGLIALGLTSHLVACANGDADPDRSPSKRPMSAQIATPSDDIIPFDGHGGATGVGRAPAEDRAVAIPEGLAEGIGSNCSQTFPPPASLPCAVPESGRVYYVNPKGNDANDGSSPEHAWATLFHAVRAAEAESTIRVAEGQYLSAVIHVDRAIILKGGFDASFNAWDPDAHPTTVLGQLSLAHDQAIAGGFHLVGRGPATEGSDARIDARHVVSGGTLIRNYVEIAYRADGNQHALYGIVASAPEGHRTRLYCNDVYVRGEGVSSSPSLEVRAIAYDGAGSMFGGEAKLASNRVCVDRSRGILSAEAIGGSASGTPGAHARVTMTNNVIEAHGDIALGLRQVLGVRFSGGLHDIDVVATNNTVYSETDGIVGEVGAGGGKAHWRLTNNVVFSTGGREAINVGPKGSSYVDIPESSGNLVFGFMHNTIVPVPRASVNDDTTNDWTVRDVLGDSFVPKASSPARRDAVNVWGDPVYGGVRTDLWSSVRPADGTWTRGAVQ